MAKLLLIAKISALFSVCILCISLSIFALHGNQTLTKIDTVAASADKATKRTDLLVKQAEYLMLNLGLTANQIRKASITQTDMLATVDAHIQKTLVDVDQFVLNADKSQVTIAATTNETIKQIQPVLAKTTETMAALQVTVEHMDKVVTDPSIPKSLQAVQASSEATASTMQHISATTGEVQQTVHDYLHPKWYTSTANWALKIVRALNPF